MWKKSANTCEWEHCLHSYVHKISDYFWMRTLPTLFPNSEVIKCLQCGETRRMLVNENVAYTLSNSGVVKTTSKSSIEFPASSRNLPSNWPHYSQAVSKNGNDTSIFDTEFGHWHWIWANFWPKTHEIKLAVRIRDGLQSRSWRDGLQGRSWQPWEASKALGLRPWDWGIELLVKPILSKLQSSVLQFVN